MAKILRGLLRGLWDEVLVELFKAGLSGGKELFAERVKSYVQTNPRAALVITLLSLDQEERANLMEAHRRAMRGGWENRFVLELGQALPRKSDGSVDEQKAKEILKQLNEVPTEELNQFLEFLNHDPIVQWFRYWATGKGKEVVIGMTEAFAELSGRGTDFVENQIPEMAGQVDRWAADTAAPAVRRFNQWLEAKQASKSWLRRLLES